MPRVGSNVAYKCYIRVEEQYSDRHISLLCQGKAKALVSNITQELKWLIVINTLAYYAKGGLGL